MQIFSPLPVRNIVHKLIVNRRKTCIRFHLHASPTSGRHSFLLYLPYNSLYSITYPLGTAQCPHLPIYIYPVQPNVIYIFYAIISCSHENLIKFNVISTLFNTCSGTVYTRRLRLYQDKSFYRFSYGLRSCLNFLAKTWYSLSY